ncbi:MAG TPA: MraY family glycosyltransferase [Fontimonas sp.]
MILSQFLIVLLISASCTAVLIFAERWHISLTGDTATEARHKVHAGTVPRVGGVAVYVAGLTGLALLSPALPDITAKILWMLWGCLTIVFVTGLIEDLTRAVSPALRYIAALGAALLFSIAHDGYGISSVGITPLDTPLNLSWIRIGFFAFAVASLSHAFNLIDGQNGLCAGVSILTFVALAITAQKTGQAPLAQLSWIMATANLGFLVFNFPFGRIFIGDGGAYFNGAIAAVITVFVVQGAGGTSPWLAILLLIYPVWETLFSMARRWHAGRPFYVADDRHLHHLAARALRRFAAKGRSYAALPVVLLVAPFVLAAPQVLDNTAAMIGLAAAFVAVYGLAYFALSRAYPEPAEPRSPGHSRGRRH